MHVWVFAVSYGLYELHHTRPLLAIALGTVFLLDLERRFMRAATFNALHIIKQDPLGTLGINILRIEAKPGEAPPMPVHPQPGDEKKVH